MQEAKSIQFKAASMNDGASEQQYSFVCYLLDQQSQQAILQNTGRFLGCAPQPSYSEIVNNLKSNWFEFVTWSKSTAKTWFTLRFGNA